MAKSIRSLPGGSIGITKSNGTTEMPAETQPVSGKGTHTSPSTGSLRFCRATPRHPANHGSSGGPSSPRGTASVTAKLQAAQAPPCHVQGTPVDSWLPGGAALQGVSGDPGCAGVPEPCRGNTGAHSWRGSHRPEPGQRSAESAVTAVCRNTRPAAPPAHHHQGWGARSREGRAGGSRHWASRE